MKKSIKSTSLILLFLMILSENVFSQSQDLYIVINEAEWCRYCKANTTRINNLIDEYVLDKQIMVVKNDVTDDESRLKSSDKLNEIGVSKYMGKHKEAAVIFVFNAKSKRILDKFSLKTKDEQVVKYLDNALQEVTRT